LADLYWISVRRLGLNLSVSVAALALGGVAFLRGEIALGACFIGLAVLRAAAILRARQPRKIEPEIKLGLDDSDPRNSS
jgi:hypothetical protein